MDPMRIKWNKEINWCCLTSVALNSNSTDIPVALEIPDRIGIWTCWLLRRREKQSAWRKTFWSRVENQQLKPTLWHRVRELNSGHIGPLHHTICMGYWPSVRSTWLDIGQVLFLRVYINSQKRTRPISNHLDRTNLVNKGFIIWLWGNFSCGIQRVVPSGQDGSILPAQVANHSTRFGSSCPLAELVI